jgi:hypothetical protein
MRNRSFVGLVLGSFLLTVCAVAQKVQTDYDHHANFGDYHTYHWEKVHTSDPLWQDRIKDAVDKELQAKGWERTNSGADVALAAIGASHNQREYQTFYDGFGGWRWRGFGGATTTVTNYQVGTLVLDMYDSKDKKLIWRGSATDTLSDKPEKNEDKLEKSVRKMLDHFPPKEKG